MYLAQHMLSLLEEGSKSRNRIALAQVGLLSRWEQAAGLFQDVLDNYDLFSFDESALIPASDIHTDTERGLLGIAGYIVKKPRRLFSNAAKVISREQCPSLTSAIPKKFKIGLSITGSSSDEDAYSIFLEMGGASFRLLTGCNSTTTSATF